MLRFTVLATMTAALEWNLHRGQRNARLFVIGSHYRLEGKEAVERRVLTLGATGEAREKGLYDSPREYTFADLKGDLDVVGAMAGGFRWSQNGLGAFHPARRGMIHLNSAGSGQAGSYASIGEAGQLVGRLADQLKLRQDVFLAELRLAPLYAAMDVVRQTHRYEPPPRFPSVERDFSLLLADGTLFSDVSKTIQSLAIGEISSIEATDLFRGKNVPAGKYSLLVRVTFQSRESTLTDTQIADFSGRIVQALEKQLGAQLRAPAGSPAGRAALQS